MNDERSKKKNIYVYKQRGPDAWRPACRWKDQQTLLEKEQVNDHLIYDDDVFDLSKTISKYFNLIYDKKIKFSGRGYKAKDLSVNTLINTSL